MHVLRFAQLRVRRSARTSRSGQPALISWQSTLPKRYLRALTAASAHGARSTAARSTSSRRPSSRGAARIGGVGVNHWRRHERNGNIENKGSRSIWNSPAGQPVQDLAGRVSCSASDCQRVESSAELSSWSKIERPGVESLSSCLGSLGRLSMARSRKLSSRKG